MTEKNKPTKKLSLSRSVESSKVSQTFSRGRNKTVTVEVKKRSFSKDASQGQNTSVASQEDMEKQRKLELLEKAKERKRDNIPPPVKQDAVQPKPAPKPKSQDETFVPKESTEQHEPKYKKKTPAKDELKPAPKPKFKEEKKQKTKLTISNIYEHTEERMRSMASVKRARQKAKRKDEPGEQAFVSKTIVLPEIITLQELANRMAVRVQDLTKALMKMGEMKQAGEELDLDTAELLVEEFGHTAKRVAASDVEDLLQQDEPTEEELAPRAPVVTIMGHVDHGKTSLLDTIRKTNVTEGEAGGITQHIGAYQILHNNQPITFLDTPGHAAFTAMRQRGANVTDIVILVVAADDGIMPQTEEAISHAKAAEVPIIVAINKIDKPEADPTKIKNELLKYDLVPEEFGGDIQTVEVSAKTGQNLDDLLETILLQTEILELKAAQNRRATGTVIEAEVDKGRGVLATLLVQQGTLKRGDIVVAGTGYGKAKAITDDKGARLKEAGPSMPVEILGLSEAPQAGDSFAVADSEKIARDVVEYREKVIRDLKAVEAAGGDSATDINRLFQTASGAAKELNLIIKGDVQGSVEAIISSLQKYSSDEVMIKIVHSGAGGITESDATLAAATNALILGFNVRASGKVKQIAEEEKVHIHYYSIIYNLLDDVKAIVSGMMSPVRREEFIGNAEILEVFKLTKIGKVAGCVVKDGFVKRGAGVRLIRDDVVIHEGKLKTLKRFKDEVDEVKQGTECGMAFENYEDIKVGDVIECYDIIEEARTLDD